MVYHTMICPYAMTCYTMYQNSTHPFPFSRFRPVPRIDTSSGEGAGGVGGGGKKKDGKQKQPLDERGEKHYKKHKQKTEPEKLKTKIKPQNEKQKPTININRSCTRVYTTKRDKRHATREKDAEGYLVMPQRDLSPSTEAFDSYRSGRFLCSRPARQPASCQLYVALSDRTLLLTANNRKITRKGHTPPPGKKKKKTRISL